MNRRMKNRNGKSLFVLMMCFFTASLAFGQVELSRESTEKEKKKRETEKTENEVSNQDGATSVFITANWSSTFRRLEENEGLYGDSLGFRADETALKIWSFSIGLRNQFHKYFVWEGGISLQRNGESFKYSGPDSSFAYDTRYTYVSMPIKVLFTYGDKVKLFAGGGVVAQMLAGYKQEQRWTTAKSESVKETLEISPDRTSSFVLSGVLNVGAQLSMGKRMSLIVMPEYKIQMTSSYLKTESYKHFGNSLGLNFGLVVQL